MPIVKGSLVVNENKDYHKDGFHKESAFNAYHLEKFNDDAYFTNTKSPHLFWAHEDYPLILSGDTRKTNLTKIGKFKGGLEEVKEALGVMCFLKGPEMAYVLHFDAYDKCLYRVMVPKERKFRVSESFKGIKTADEYREIYEAKRKENAPEQETEAPA